MLYYTTAISKSLEGKFSYGQKLRSSQSHDFEVLLPSLDNEPDSGLMDDFISAIKKMVISDVVCYTERKLNATRDVISR